MTNAIKPTDRSSAAQQFLDDYLHKVPDGDILAQLDAAITAKPSLEEIRQGADAALGWLGGVKAALYAWDRVRTTALLTIESELNSELSFASPGAAYRKLITLIQEARAALVLKAGRPSTVAAKGMVHDYFDGLRKIIARAEADIYFADPFMDAEFIDLYMPYVQDGVVVRLLGRKHMKTLLPAADMFAKQHGTKIQIRSLGEHDRFVFIDGKECYQSGATFHQGAVTAGTSIIPVIDAADALRTLFEAHWKSAKVERM